MRWRQYDLHLKEDGSWKFMRSVRLDGRDSDFEACYISFIYGFLADRSHSIHLQEAHPNSPRLPRAPRKLSGSGSLAPPRLDPHNRLPGANMGRPLGSGSWERTHDLLVEGGISGPIPFPLAWIGVPVER